LFPSPFLAQDEKLFESAVKTSIFLHEDRAVARRPDAVRAPQIMRESTLSVNGNSDLKEILRAFLVSIEYARR